MIYKIFSPSLDIEMSTPLDTEEEAEHIASTLREHYPGVSDWEYKEAEL